MVTSKCTIARLDPSGVGMRVEVEITHSLVSGDSYGRAWYTCPGRRAKVGAKKGAPDSSGDRSLSVARSPRTMRAFSGPLRSMKQASPMLSGNNSSR